MSRDAAAELNPLNVHIAERVMGWRLIRALTIRERDAYSFWDGGNSIEVQRLLGLPYGRFIASRWRPCHDLNAAALAQAKMIELGHGGAYIDALFRIVNADMWPDNPFMAQHIPVQDQEMGPLVAHVATAPADARCRAMLAVLEGQR